jgi:hypothetical protein
MGVTITKDKVAEIMRAFSDLTKKDVLVGVPDSSPERESGEPISNAAIGYILETGSPVNNLEPRPHLVPGVASVQSQVADRFGKCATSALDGNQAGADKQLVSAGLIAQDAVKEMINSNIQPALSAATLASRRRRGVTRENTLVDTGQYRNSITYVIRSKK